MCVCVCVCVSTFIHTNIHACMHTYIHTYIHTLCVCIYIVHVASCPLCVLICMLVRPYIYACASLYVCAQVGLPVCSVQVLESILRTLFFSCPYKCLCMRIDADMSYMS